MHSPESSDHQQWHRINLHAHALSRNFIHMTVAVNDRKHCRTFNSIQLNASPIPLFTFCVEQIALNAFSENNFGFWFSRSLPFTFDTEPVSLTPCDGIIIFSLYWFFSQSKSSAKYHFLQFCFACRRQIINMIELQIRTFTCVIEMNFGVKIFTQAGQGSSLEINHSVVTEQGKKLDIFFGAYFQVNYTLCRLHVSATNKLFCF